MKTKEEVIKEAWGIHYGADVDKNGWRESNIGGLSWDKTYFDILKKSEEIYLIRPHILNDIETNSGWIRIESEEDLPKDSFNYYLYCNDGRLLDMKEYDYYKKYIVPELKATHYQPIIKPKPPLY